MLIKLNPKLFFLSIAVLATVIWFASNRTITVSNEVATATETVSTTEPAAAARLLNALADFEPPPRCGERCRVFVADSRLLSACFQENDSCSTCCTFMETAVAAGGITANDSDAVLLGVESAACEVDCVAVALHQSLPKKNLSNEASRPFTLLSFAKRNNWVFITDPGGSSAGRLKPRGIVSINLALFDLLPSVAATRNSGKQGKVWAPANISEFLWQWERSEFRECSDSAQRIRAQKLNDGVPKSQIADDAVNDLAYIRDIMAIRGITPMLTGGTLLGWMRECGIIDGDNDLDFAVLWEEAKDHSLSDVWFFDQRTPLCRAMELPNHPYEYTVTIASRGSRVSVDIFFLYPDGKNGVRMESVSAGGEKLRWNYPTGIQGVCAVDLYGELFHIACNGEDYVRETYGPDWMTPKPKSCWFCTPNVEILEILPSKVIDEIYTFCTDCYCSSQKTERPTANVKGRY